MSTRAYQVAYEPTFNLSNNKLLCHLLKLDNSQRPFIVIKRQDVIQALADHYPTASSLVDLAEEWDADEIELTERLLIQILNECGEHDYAEYACY